MVFDQAFELTARDNQPVVADLMRLLLLGGLAMTMAGSSAPASQSEHMVAHVYDLLWPERETHFHGEEIAATTLTMTMVQETYLPYRPRLRPVRFDGEAMRAAFGGEMAQAFAREYQLKAERIRDANAEQKLAQDWPAIADAITPHHLPFDELAAICADARMEPTADALDWPMDRYERAIALARFTRDRFTFLDLEL
jgi:glycerol-1-phosphate dehydrogenase [NAD(P)+]